MNHVNCGWVEVNYPVDSAGNRHVWHCECKTTACQKPTNHFVEMYNDRELSQAEEERFYKKVFKTNLI